MNVMIVEKRIPLLHDHHTHPSTYAAMDTCIDLRAAAAKDEALARLRQEDDDVVFALGWNDSLYTFEDDDLARLPPVFILNTSLHGHRKNAAAQRELARTHPNVVRHLDDSDWLERNLHAIFKLIVDRRGCDAQRPRRLLRRAGQRGVWWLGPRPRRCSCPTARSVGAFAQAGLLERTAFWGRPGNLSFARRRDATARARHQALHRRRPPAPAPRR